MRIFSIIFGVVVSAGSLTLSNGAEAENIWSPAQRDVVDRGIKELKSPEERSLANGWSDAKKVAEFICRPLAQSELKRSVEGADRVFLGTDDPGTLDLASSELLTGSGQVRSGSDWTSFTFECGLDPKTGKATSFEATLTSGQ